MERQDVTIPLEEYVQLTKSKARFKILEEQHKKLDDEKELQKRLTQYENDLQATRATLEDKNKEIRITKTNVQTMEMDYEKTTQERNLLQVKLDYLFKDYNRLKDTFDNLNAEIISSLGSLWHFEDSSESGVVFDGGNPLSKSYKQLSPILSTESPRNLNMKPPTEQRKKPRLPNYDKSERKVTTGKNAKPDIGDETDTIEEDFLSQMQVSDETEDSKLSDLDETEELSTSVLFKNPQKCVFVVNYQAVMDVMHKIIESGQNVAKIKGYPSILANDVFREYTKSKNIDIFEGIVGEKERKNHLRYNVGTFNKCLKRLEDARVRKGKPQNIRIVTSCYVYIQCVGERLRFKHIRTQNL